MNSIGSISSCIDNGDGKRFQMWWIDREYFSLIFFFNYDLNIYRFYYQRVIFFFYLRLKSRRGRWKPNVRVSLTNVTARPSTTLKMVSQLF